MNTQEEFLNNINKTIKDISLENSKKIIYKLASKLDQSKYEMTLCIIDHIIGIKRNNDDLLKEFHETKAIFKKIENGDICIRCYERESYNNSFLGEDYYFYPSKKLNHILNNTYELGKKLIFHKIYDQALEIFDLILYTNYQCEEIANPEYADFEEVIDVFDSDIHEIRASLDFNLDYVYLYSIYAILIRDYPNKYERIYNYLKDYKYLDIKMAMGLGVENINNIEKIYEEFKEYLTNKKDNISNKILENME